MADLKYYLYVSDTKLDMLFGQIPAKLARSITAELALDFKLVSLKLKSQAPDETRYSKLKVVEQFLRRSERIGTIDDPGPYVGGSWPLVFAIVGPTAVFFGRAATTLIGLTGSAHHVTGNAQKPAIVHVGSISHAALPEVARTLTKVGGEHESDPGDLRMDPSSALAFVFSQAEARRPQRVEFLARTMYVEEVSKKEWGEAYKKKVAGVSHVLLGSPLYVALPG